VNPTLPLSAIVGQVDLKLALLLVAVDPTIGGVLVTGERGTAKSTAARALAALLPPLPDGRPAPFVELPLGATEDRVVGSMDVAQALKDGRAELKSGLLARADGGVLYVDEVNLLPDHLVDLLLDTAASGRLTIERDGLSRGETARFLLIGTMNPEEGELRPQFLDRFGLCVRVSGLSETPQRIEAVRQRMLFDDAPEEALARVHSEDERLRAGIVTARSRLKQVRFTDADLSKIAALAAERQSIGLRGDIAAIKAARALAAWEGATEVEPQHIERTVELAMTHRVPRRMRPQRRSAPDAKSTSTEGISPKTSSPAHSPSDGSRAEVPRTARAPRQELVADPSDPIDLITEGVSRKESGRRETESMRSGRIVGSSLFDGTATLAIRESVTAAALRGVREGGEALPLKAVDLRQLERRGAGRCHVLFLVDVSGSMGVSQRLAYAKQMAQRLLTSSYQRRDEVALMVFRGEGAELVLPFTRDVRKLDELLQGIATGGRTPLAGALHEAARVARTRDSVLVVLFTDGRANVALGAGDPWEEALIECEALAGTCAGALVIDCEVGPIVLGRAQRVAQALDAECLSLNAEVSDVVIDLRDRLAATE
jgi:magnesium chelatase subunit D